MTAGKDFTVRLPLLNKWWEGKGEKNTHTKHKIPPPHKIKINKRYK